MRKGGYVCTREREQRRLDELDKACDELLEWFFCFCWSDIAYPYQCKLFVVIACQVGTIVTSFQVIDWVLSWLLIHPWCIYNLLGVQEAGGAHLAYQWSPSYAHAYWRSGLQILPEFADRLVSNFSSSFIDGEAPGLSFSSRCSMECAFYCWQAAISGL